MGYADDTGLHWTLIAVDGRFWFLCVHACPKCRARGK